MMALLIQDITANRFDLGGADGERSVALLPRESREPQFAVNPGGRLAFQLPHHIRQAMGGLESGKNVDVIRGAADRVSDSARASNRYARP